jgi:CheY-like chemotaxis protein
MPSPIKHIVLADDDPDNFELFADAVAETCTDINLRSASDGEKLLSLIKQLPRPDLILLDLNMPCKSGHECLEEIRSKEEFDDVPVVILSTSSSQRDKDACFKGGATGYLVKPHSHSGMKAIAKNMCLGNFSPKL